MELNKLQNGTDIRGIAIEFDNNKVNLTIEAVSYISSGFLKWVKENNNIEGDIKISVGMDSRLSGPSLKEAIIDALVSGGATVYDCGICTTPAMFMTTVHEEYKCHGAIMITASHLPFYFNGIKFFTERGGCEKEDIKEILLKSDKPNLNNEKKGRIITTDFIDKYSKILVNKIITSVNSKENYLTPLKGTRIIVDAGNGAGGFFASKILEKLGASTEGSQFLNPNGNFPNHIPNPEDPEAMKSIKDAVLKHKADLGIIFDTDVDRAAIVSSDGEEINRNSLIALISSIILEEHPKTVVVTDSVTSTGLGEFIENLDGVHHRFKRGYKNVINEAKRLNNQGNECHLAIETSGHAAIKENYFLDDGAYLIGKILCKMAKMKEVGKDIQSLIKDLKKPVESCDIRIKIKADDLRSYGESIINALNSYVKEVDGWSLEEKNYEGIRVNCDKYQGNGWFLLRLSLHEPMLALNIESNTQGGTKKIIEKLLPFLKEYEELNFNNLS